MLVLAACGAPPAVVAPAVVSPAPSAAPAGAIEVPSIEVDDPRRHRSGGIYVFQTPDLRLLEPPRSATLTTDPRQVATLDVLLRERIAAAGRLDRIRAAVARGPSKQRATRFAQIRAAAKALDATRERLIAGLAVAKLAPDGIVLDVLLRTARARDRHDDEVEHHLDVDPDAPEPVADYRDPLAAIAVAQRGTLGPSTRGIVDFARAYIDSQQLDATIRHAAAIAMLALARATPAVAEAAYAIAGHALIDGTTPEDVAGTLEAFGWLGGHAATPETRGFSRYLFGRTQRLAGDPAAVASLCGVTGPLDQMLLDDAHDDLVQAIVATHSAAAFATACDDVMQECPCLPDVVAPVGYALADAQYHAAAASALGLAVARFPAVEPACALVALAAQDPSPHRVARAQRLADGFATQFGAAWKCAWSAPVEHAADSPTTLIAQRFPHAAVAACAEPHARVTIELAIAGVAVSRATALASTLSPANTACVVAALTRTRWSGLDAHVVRIPIEF